MDETDGRVQLFVGVKGDIVFNPELEWWLEAWRWGAGSYRSHLKSEAYKHPP